MRFDWLYLCTFERSISWKQNLAYYFKTDKLLIFQCSSHLYSALRQFLQVFPEVSKAPLYIAGESYAGRYLPALGVKILEQDRSIGTLDVNLQVRRYGLVKNLFGHGQSH